MPKRHHEYCKKSYKLYVSYNSVLLFVLLETKNVRSNKKPPSVLKKYAKLTTNALLPALYC